MCARKSLAAERALADTCSAVGSGVKEYSGPDIKAYFSPDELSVLTPTPVATRSQA